MALGAIFNKLGISGGCQWASVVYNKTNVEKGGDKWELKVDKCLLASIHTR